MRWLIALIFLFMSLASVEARATDGGLTELLAQVEQRAPVLRAVEAESVSARANRRANPVVSRDKTTPPPLPRKSPPGITVRGFLRPASTPTRRDPRWCR